MRSGGGGGVSSQNEEKGIATIPATAINFVKLLDIIKCFLLSQSYEIILRLHPFRQGKNLTYAKFILLWNKRLWEFEDEKSIKGKSGAFRMIVGEFFYFLSGKINANNSSFREKLSLVILDFNRDFLTYNVWMSIARMIEIAWVDNPELRSASNK